MPERLTNVTVQTDRRFLPLPWDSRIALLERLRHLDAMKPTRDAFENAGISGPVRIPEEQKGPLVGVLTSWAQQATVDGLPEGVWTLRNALDDDLHAAPHGCGR